MNQFLYSGKDRQRIEEFMRRREARLYNHLGRLYEASIHAGRQHEQAAQSPPLGERSHSEDIDGMYFVVGSSSDGLYRQELERIKALRQAVFGNDTRILVAWVLAIIAGYYGRYLLALDLLGLSAVLFYLKFVRAAKAQCPRCGQPFGSASWLPTTLGGEVCQHCGLSLKARR